MQMQYKNVYVAYVSMGANPAATVKAFNEAENYDGPALIVAYAHCIEQGLLKKGGDCPLSRLKNSYSLLESLQIFLILKPIAATMIVNTGQRMLKKLYGR